MSLQSNKIILTRAELKEIRVNENIRKYRVERCLTQEFMASSMNITQSTYYKIESGFTKISIIKLQKIADILDIPLDSFFKNDYVRPSDLEVLENTIMKKDLRIKELEHQLLSMSFMVDALKSSFVR